MARNVIAFVGENAHRILECQSRRFMDLLAPYDLQGHVLRVSGPGFQARLAELLSEGVAFAWGYAGVGARLALDGDNLWHRTQIPFVSALFDPPYLMPANHAVRSDYVINGYAYRDWLDLQHASIRSRQISALLPMGVVRNPDARTPWRQRSNRMVFVKSGGDPASQRAKWQAWPLKLRTILETAADDLATRRTCPIYPVVQATLTAHAISLAAKPALLLGLLHELDTYVRCLRATAFATAMLPFPADIIGDGWHHLSSRGGKARFHPPIDAAALEALYADTQILVNANPNLGSGAHERVLRGFAARCRVVSDNNDYGVDNLGSLPSYAGLEWADPDLSGRLGTIFHDPTAFDDKLDPATDYIERRHSPHAFLKGIIELAEITRLNEVMACYAPEGASNDLPGFAKAAAWNSRPFPSPGPAFQRPGTSDPILKKSTRAAGMLISAR